MVLSNPDVDNALKYVKERYSQMKKKSDFRFHCMLFDIPERLRDYENNRVRTEFEAEVNRLQVPKCLMPKHPKWYDDMVEAQRRWIDANCGLPDAMKGCSEGFDSAKQHMMNYELHMRRYNEMWNPKKLIVDTDESFPDDFLIRGTWKKFHTQKEKRVNKLRLFKRIRILAGQFYAVVRALKWFGLIRWDEFDKLHLKDDCQYQQLAVQLERVRLPPLIVQMNFSFLIELYLRLQRPTFGFLEFFERVSV